MHVFPKTKELLEKEIDKLLEKGTLSPTELDNLGKALDAYKDCCEIMEMHREEEYDDGYSSRRMGGRSMRGYDGRSYGYDMPYDMSYNRSYDEGMSRHDGVSRSIDVLKSMLNTAETEKERRAIRNHIAELER